MPPLLSREKSHQITYIFMTKIIIVNYTPFSKIFQNLLFVELTNMSKAQVINFQKALVKKKLHLLSKFYYYIHKY